MVPSAISVSSSFYFGVRLASKSEGSGEPQPDADTYTARSSGWRLWPGCRMEHSWPAWRALCVSCFPKRESCQKLPALRKPGSCARTPSPAWFALHLCVGHTMLYALFQDGFMLSPEVVRCALSVMDVRENIAKCSSIRNNRLNRTLRAYKGWEGSTWFTRES